MHNSRLPNNPKRRTVLRPLFLMIALRTLVPQNLDHIPIERLLKVRERHKADFWNYRKRIGDITAGLAKLRGVTDLDTLAQHVELEYEKTLAKDLSDVRRILKSNRLDVAETALAIKIAAPTTLLGTAVSGLAGIAAGAAAATAVGLFSTARGILAQRRETLTESPATWLLRIERELQPAGLAQSVAQRVKAFLH
jgi:Family of unknown function (DUF6236)